MISKEKAPAGGDGGALGVDQYSLDRLPITVKTPSPARLVLRTAHDEHGRFMGLEATWPRESSVAIAEGRP